MLELYFAACLLLAPTTCRDVRLIFSDESVTEMQCSIGRGGVDRIADWLRAHPGYYAKRWQCRRAGLWAKA